MPSTTTPQHRRKNVCFAEDRNTIHLLSNQCSCDDEHDFCSPEDQWFSLDDFEDTKRKLKRKVQEWKMKGYGILLRNTFDNPHPNVQSNINAFAQLDERDCVRGVERGLSSNLDQKVGNLKRRCIKTVLSHQRIMRKDGVNEDDMRDELAVVSKMQSRASVQMARRFGKADELVLRTDEIAAALKLVEDLNAMTEKQKPRLAGIGGASAAKPRSGNNRRSPRSARIA